VKTLLATAGLALAISTAANAADISVSQCEPKTVGCAITVIKGKIEPGDDRKFAKVIEANKIEWSRVALHSDGGQMLAGLAIGRMIKAKGFETWIGNGWRCMSICAAIWLAGNPHSVHDGARIGFHSAWEFDKLDKNGNPTNTAKRVVSGPGNAIIGGYYRDLGLSDDAIWYLTSAAPNSAVWLDRSSAAMLGLNVTEK
jgi:hypothetical protein